MKNLLLNSYWIGIIADALATILLFFPKAAAIALNPQPFEITRIYLYVSRIAGSLMLGWTLLLIWAKKEPIKRADILILTVFIVILLALSSIMAVKTNLIAFIRMLPMFILYVIIFSTFIPSYFWAKKQIKKEKA